MNSWRRALIAMAAEFGASVERTKSAHYKIVHPSGWFVFTSSTPGDYRTLQNIRSEARRAATGRKERTR